MRWMRHIAWLALLLLCLVNGKSEQQPHWVVCEQIAGNVEREALRVVLHDYSDLGTLRTIESTSGSTRTLRIPHKRGTQRHLTWLSLRPSAPTYVTPLFHGGHHSPKTVTRRQTATELCRLCRLII